MIFVFKWKVEVMTRSIVEPPPSLASNPKEFYKIKNAYTHNPQSVRFLTEEEDKKDEGEKRRKRGRERERKKEKKKKKEREKNARKLGHPTVILQLEEPRHVLFPTLLPAFPEFALGFFHCGLGLRRSFHVFRNDRCRQFGPQPGLLR